MEIEIEHLGGFLLIVDVPTHLHLLSSDIDAGQSRTWLTVRHMLLRYQLLPCLLFES